MRNNWPRIVMLAGACLVCAAHLSRAQPVPPPDRPDSDSSADEKTAPETPGSGAENALSARQRQVRERFVELERLLLRMAELTAPTDPARAALLRQAVAQSKQRDIDQQFEELVKLLGQDRLSLAVKGQGEVQRDLAKLLELLLSEDRTKRIETEKERIREYLKRVNKIIKEQKSVQGETARDGDAKQLADRQGDLSDKTGELAKDLEQDAAKSAPKEDAQKDADKDKQPGEQNKEDKKKPANEGKEEDKDKEGSKPGDADKPGDAGKPDDAKDSQKGKPGDKNQSKPGEKGDSDEQQKNAQGKPGQPQNQPPMPGQPGQGQPGEPPPQNENPAQKRLEQAQQRMKEAQEKLEQAKRDDAKDKQAEALKELEQAKADLEEILRQLREEEMARMLAMLENRFRKMLDAQIEVYEGTKRLDQVPAAERDRDDEIESGRLGRKEAQIVVEADKCLALLHEEGSAVAFPEAVTGIRDDMQTVAEHLAQSKVGQITQAIETDIIAALEEMIAALKKAQKDMEQKQQQGEPGEAGESEPPLVDVLAELKMIRALQMRVNVRTQRYAELTKQEQVDTPELLEALRRLAEREQRIHKVTRDIVVGRNR